MGFFNESSHLSIFTKGKRMDSVVQPKVGLQTGDNDRFLRQWWEVDINKAMFNTQSIHESLESGLKWFPYNKGGSYRRWYGNYDYFVNWENDGFEIRNFTDDKGKLRSVVRNPSFYFQEAITWSDITSGEFAIRFRLKGSIHDVTGMSAFGDHKTLMMLLSLMNTKIAKAVFKMVNPTMHLQIGNFQIFPVILEGINHSILIELSTSCVECAMIDWNSNETSMDYGVKPYFIP